MLRAVFASLICSIATGHAQVGFDRSYWNPIAEAERPHHHGLLKSGGVPNRGFDLKYHCFDWNYDPADSAIGGAVTSHFLATLPLVVVRYDLDEAMIADSVTNGRGGTSLAFTHNGDSLLVTLATSLAMGAMDSTTVYYHGHPSGSGFGSFGWGVHGTPEVPMLWTLSEPYGAMDWWPCKQDLNDKIDSIEAFVTTPNAYRSAGNGVLVSETDDGSFRTCQWKHRHPIDVYLIATAATNYQVLTDTIHLPGGIDVPMITYTWPEEAFIAGLVAGDVAQQMPFYSEKFGTYPYADEQYGHARFGWGGGMEHQTMTFMGGWWYELASHELAHQWFGDKVTCGSWADLWLNEGFATYLSGLCYEFLAPVYWPGWTRNKVNDIVSQPDGSVSVGDTLDINRLFNGRLTYNKGAMLAHMLRWVSGDSAFFQGLRNYLDDPALAYGTARTGDLVAHLEATSGLDLTGFMQDWFTGEGFPTYTVEWTQDAGGNVSIQLDQSSSHPSVSFFEMPVPITFKNSVQDSTVVLDHSFSGQTFSFHLPFQADSALFDPTTWIISGSNLVLRVPVASFGNGQVLLYPNPVNDEAGLYVGRTFQGEVNMRIIDAMGRVVKDHTLPIAAQRTSFSARELVPGCYILDLDNGALRLTFVKD